MSLRWRDRREELFARASARDELRRDWSPPRRRAGRPIAWIPLLAVMVLSLLLLTALRLSILRTRYALGATLQQETELLARQRTAAVAAREERDPHRLRELAAQRGFARPERVIDLSAHERDR